ncbi:MAG: hypothetical protein IAE82_03725, partial [Opitutaceae bacterium]|nr:hypothetical protein [Opitutaceae bacterium]
MSPLFRRLVSPLLAALVVLPLLHAQPSGGPYGPQPQRYEVPTGAKSVVYVSPDGKADAPGA